MDIRCGVEAFMGSEARDGSVRGAQRLSSSPAHDSYRYEWAMFVYAARSNATHLRENAILCNVSSRVGLIPKTPWLLDSSLTMRLSRSTVTCPT